VVDGSENTQNSYRYEAFGQVQSSTENATNPYRYVGAYGVHWDASAALYFMQARYYMASVGRFIAVDPLPGVPGNPVSLRAYLYVNNNPVNQRDPVGASRYAICEGLPSVAYNICKRVIDYLCALGPEACCTRDLINDIEECNRKYCDDARRDACYAMAELRYTICMNLARRH